MIELSNTIIEPQTADQKVRLIIRKHELERDELKNNIKLLNKELASLKPTVESYNAKAKYRKDLRRELAAKERVMKIVESFFNDTTLFANPHQPQSKQPEKCHEQ